MNARLSFIVFLVFATSFVKGQEKKYTDSAVSAYIDACKCVVRLQGNGHDNAYWLRTINTIRYHHPEFRKAIKILYISFIDRNNQNTFSYLSGGRLNSKEIIAQKELNSGQIDSLMFTLYANRFAGYPLKKLVFDCQHPANAVVFLDQDGSVFTALNIDFKGTAFNVWRANGVSKKYEASFGDTCFGKYDLIKSLFQSAGIKTFN